MLPPAPTSDDDATRRTGGRWCWAVVVAFAAAVVIGALQLEFLCDDAFITFRYVANAHDGRGLVWNAEPFAPVEGYTGFLWALCLWGVWSVFDVEPPAAANVLSIALGVLQFLVVAVAALQLRDRRGRPLHCLAVACTLLVVASNRTFLTWCTGGLETALFNLAFVGWVLLAFRSRERRGTGWLAAWSAAAAAAALTRPDGLLPVAATGGVALLLVLRRERPLGATLRGLAPLATVALHLAWRRWYYGEWLPNTYYAKVTAPWPEAGVRFLGCFLLEHGAWLWPPIAATWLAVEFVGARHTPWRRLLAAVPAVVAVAVVLVHAAYYVVRVGGDPFEYRVFSPLVPLGALMVAAMAARMRAGAAAVVVGALAVAFASGFGWLHLALHEPNLTPFYRPIAARVPAWLEPIAHWHDRQQAWMKLQVLCGRSRTHALFLQSLVDTMPARARATVDPDDVPVAEFTGVGYAGWVLPDIAILDKLGLNDWVVARTPVVARQAPLPREVLAAVLGTADVDHDGRYTGAELRAAFAALPGFPPDQLDAVVALLLLLFAEHERGAIQADEAQRIEPFFAGLRFMAHERQAPQAYRDAFAPNVTVTGRAAVVAPRAVPLTPVRVRAIEAEWRARIRGG